MRTCLYTIEQVLPHDHPMILLDTVDSIDGNALEATVTIGPCSAFRRAEGVPVHVAIEYMAQACGAFVGIEALDAGGVPRVGLLLGSRNFSAERRWLRDGERFRVRVEVAFREGNMGVFDCHVAGDDGGEHVASARLTVYQPAEGESVESIGG